MRQGDRNNLKEWPGSPDGAFLEIKSEKNICKALQLTLYY